MGSTVSAGENAIPNFSIQTAAVAQEWEPVDLSLTVKSEQSRWSYWGIVDAATFTGPNAASWLYGSTGKFRGGRNSNDVVIQAAGSLDYQLSTQSKLSIEAAYYADPNDNFGITQAFWQTNSTATKHWQSQYRVGAFHVPISFENQEAMWQSAYTLSPSMINTWVGEELRSIGVEGRWSWRPSQNSEHEFTLLSAVFGANDSAGAMLAWRGWAAHDRQSLLGSTIRMPALPVTQPGAPFSQQAAEYEAFVEVDKRIGYFLGLDWKHWRGGAIRYVYYDNRGDPMVLERGQYAWDTRFHHVGLTMTPAAGWTVVGQAILGNTIMGPKAVDNDFGSASLLVSRAFINQRVSARLETFKVVDHDFLQTLDPNDENGERLTIGYTFQAFDSNWSATLEASRIRSDRAYRGVFSQAEKSTDDQFSVLMRYRF